MEPNGLQGPRMNSAAVVFAMPAEFGAFRDPALSKYILTIQFLT